MFNFSLTLSVVDSGKAYLFPYSSVIVKLSPTFKGSKSKAGSKTGLYARPASSPSRLATTGNAPQRRGI